MERNELLEKNFEADIEQWLTTKGGYTKGVQTTYDKERAIDLDTLVAFIAKTQPKAWKRYTAKYGSRANEQLYSVFQDDVTRYGLIYVLRKGIDDFGIKLKLCYFAPASELNEELVEHYKENILTCTRQFAYSTRNHNTIDMVLSLNGIPVVALELKNQFTGQSIQDSIEQWRKNRDPKEELFHFNNRILAYFGVDLYEATVSTELKGENTYFIPFNQGSNGAGKVGGAGNPQAPEAQYVTAYLWQQVLRRDMLLAILQRYVMVQEEKEIKIVVDKHGKATEKSSDSRKLIFPRFHQLDVVEKLVADTLTQGSGHNYLIQHSAGSGKSNSIAWLTYRLASLHNRESINAFDGVFVVTDRRILNRQLQNTILGFEHIDGTVETVTDKDNSEKLRKLIDDGVARIIITTLHRFPIIWDKLKTHKGKRYAIIVDEAHSSQSGKSAEKLKAALADTEEALQEMAEIEETSEEELEKDMDSMMLDLLTQGEHNNLSFYAFTATPKPKTLQKFGVLAEKGASPKEDKYTAFHNYSMLQAIEEGFILDVLKNYTTFQTSYEIAKRIEDNPEYEETPATRALKIFHDDHSDTINKKTRIIVEKFREVTLTRMDGKAKAMVVTRSRAHALRYYFAVKQYCTANGITDVHPMVAFSGKVKYGDTEYTETMLNSTEERKISEDRLPLYFASELYNMLIVADKYQTGFDEPQLHTMFVDKRLKTVKAVQTLSRLNRWHKLKKDTFVFDFANETEAIKKSFEPFYKSTELINPVDVNYVYTFRKDIETYRLWTIAEEEAFYNIVKALNPDKDKSRLAALSNALKPTVERFLELEEEKRFEVRSKIKNFVRFYAYMAQIARTFDKSLYKAYIYADYLYRVLPKTAHEKVDLDKKVLLLNSRIEQGDTIDITLGEGDPIKGENPKGGIKPTDKRDLLSNIIEKVNLMYQGNFTPEDRVMVEGIYDLLKKTAESRMRRQANNNDENQFIDSIFPKIFNDAAQKCYTSQTDAFRKLFKNQEFYNQIMRQMGHAMYEHYHDQEEQAYTPENLKAKMVADIEPEFSVIKNSSRTVEEAFDWTIRLLQDKSFKKYAGLKEVVLDAFFKLYCTTQPLSTSEKRSFLRNIVTGYESYLKKLYFTIESKEVTDKNGSADYAALSNAIFYLKHLQQLKHLHTDEAVRFGGYLEKLVSLRNTENHSGQEISEQEIQEGIHLVSTMYLYVTFRYITELEMAESGTHEMPYGTTLSFTPEESSIAADAHTDFTLSKVEQEKNTDK